MLRCWRCVTKRPRLSQVVELLFSDDHPFSAVCPTRRRTTAAGWRVVPPGRGHFRSSPGVHGMVAKAKAGEVNLARDCAAATGEPLATAGALMTLHPQPLAKARGCGGLSGNERHQSRCSQQAPAGRPPGVQCRMGGGEVRPADAHVRRLAVQAAKRLWIAPSQPWRLRRGKYRPAKAAVGYGRCIGSACLTPVRCP